MRSCNKVVYKKLNCSPGGWFWVLYCKDSLTSHETHYEEESMEWSERVGVRGETVTLDKDVNSGEGSGQQTAIDRTQSGVGIE